MPEFYNDVLKLRKLLYEGADINSKSNDSYKKSLLHIAVESRNLDSLKFIVDQKVDVNSTDAFGETPLHYAFKKMSDICDQDQVYYSCAQDPNIFKYLDIMEYLISKSANLKKYSDVITTLTVLHLYFGENEKYFRIKKFIEPLLFDLYDMNYG